MMKYSGPIERFKILGLKNYRNVELVFQANRKIIVGENGLSKTTILNALYFTISRKWELLERIEFDFIEVVFNNHIVEFSQSDLRMYLAYIHSEDEYFNIFSVKEFERINLLLELEFKDRVCYFPIFRNVDQLIFSLLGVRVENFWESKDHDMQTLTLIKETVIKYKMDEINELFEVLDNSPFLNPFIDVCNSYLSETKFLFNKLNKPQLRNIINDELVNLEYLSSGEKQIISIFSKFYLSKRRDLIFLIDEPELSLSLTWQRTLLPDVLKSENCCFLLAITHSPFIFDNELDEFAEGINLSIL